MTTFEILLAFLFLVAIGLGAALRRLGSAGEGVIAAPLPIVDTPVDQFYAPMTRLFASRDVEFLHEQGGYSRKMDRRLRLQRRKVLRLYLGQIRGDFRALETYCRRLARSTRNWELSSLAHRQLVVFYGLFFALHVRCLFGSFGYVRVDTRDLVSSLRNLQQGVRSAVESPGHGVAAAWG